MDEGVKKPDADVITLPVPAKATPDIRIESPVPHSWRGEPGVCSEVSLARLQAMPEFQAGQRTVRNQQIVDEARELGRGQRRDFFGLLPALHWWEL